jgi:splicing factor 3B subunit 1
VRESYWKIYNNVYVGDQDGLVAGYPCLEDELDEDGDVANTYVRTELYYTL